MRRPGDVHNPLDSLRGEFSSSLQRVDTDRPDTGTASADLTSSERAGAAALSPAGPPRAGSRRELRALVELLDDDSQPIVGAVRGELLQYGRVALPALAKATGGDRARLRTRARDVVATLHRQEVLRRLIRFGARPRIELESAFFLLANLSLDSFDARPYRRALDAMAAGVRDLGDREKSDFGRVMALSHYLGDDLGFAGSQDEYHHPDNIHVHRAIERKCGMPLTLSAIYLFVARRAGIRAALVPLPGHVLLRLYHSDSRSVLVDPFQSGEPRSRSDCLAYLRECNMVPQPEWFEDADEGLMFLRQVMNLINSHQMRGLHGRARELQRVAGVLARVQSRRTRIRIRD